MPKIETLKKYILKGRSILDSKLEMLTLATDLHLQYLTKKVHERDIKRLDCFWIGSFHPLYPHFMPVSQNVVRVKL